MSGSCATILNSSADRCTEVPLPDEAIDSFPGRAFA